MTVRIGCRSRTANIRGRPFVVRMIVPVVHLESLPESFLDGFRPLRLGATAPDEDPGAYAAEEGEGDEDTGGPCWALEPSEWKDRENE